MSYSQWTMFSTLHRIVHLQGLSETLGYPLALSILYRNFMANIQCYINLALSSLRKGEAPENSEIKILIGNSCISIV